MPFIDILIDALQSVWRFGLDCLMVLWRSIPLIAANMLPVVFGKLGRSLGPIDNGVRWIDDQPLLGEGKTWSGLIGGFAGAVIITLFLMAITMLSGLYVISDAWGQGMVQPLVHITSLALGAVLADLISSFFKRRMGLPPGARLPFIDQFDAVIGGFGLTALVDWLAGWNWFFEALIPGRFLPLTFMCLVYYVSHRGLSIWAHRKGLKSTAY